MSDEHAIEMFSEDDYKSPFDHMAHLNEQGEQYWSARELMAALEYTDWRNFKAAIKRAMQSCASEGYHVPDQFVEANELIEHGKGGKRKVESYQLTRLAAYLTVMNGDPSKRVVAQAQSYFYQKVAQAELFEKHQREQKKLKRGRAVTGYLNDGRSAEWANKRVDSKASVARLNGAAQDTHETNSPDFGALHGEINQGLFQMTKDEIVSYLGLRPADAPKFRDHLGQYALDTLVQINHAASTKMNQYGRPLTADEQLTIIRDVVAILAPTMRALAAYVQVDFVSGAPVDEYGRPQILRNLPLLGAAS
jgi:hypothetical protein